MGRDLPGVVLQVFFEGLQVVGLGLGRDHGVHHVIHDGAGIDRVLVVLIFLRLGLNAHHAGHHAGHVQGFGLDGDGVTGKGVLLNLIDVILYAVGQRHNQRDANDADAARKGCQDGAGLFGHQVIGGQGQSGEKAHGGLFPLAGGSAFGVAGDIWIAVVHDKSVLQPDDPAGIFHGQLRVVGHHNDELVPGDLLQQVHDLYRGVRVQGAGRLVRHEDVRIVHQGAGNGYPLHLAAGHLVGLFVKLIPKPHLLQGFLGPGLTLRRANAGKGQRQLHIGKHRLMGDQVIGLEYKTHRVVAVGIPVAVGKVFCGFSVDNQVPGGILIQAPDDIQQRGLTAAGVAQDGYKLAFTEFQVHAFQRMNHGVPSDVILFDRL